MAECPEARRRSKLVWAVVIGVCVFALACPYEWGGPGYLARVVIDMRADELEDASVNAMRADTGAEAEPASEPEPEPDAVAVAGGGTCPKGRGDAKVFVVSLHKTVSH